MANALIGSKVAMAALPGGSTNVFTRTIGMPRNLDKAVAQLRTSLDGGAVRGMPVGNVNGRRFLFHVGIGFDAAVVAQVERRASLKRTIGQAVFVYATMATLLRHFDRKRPGFTMRFPDGTRIKAFYAVVMNSNPYTYLGRRPLTLTHGRRPRPGSGGRHGQVDRAGRRSRACSSRPSARGDGCGDRPTSITGPTSPASPSCPAVPSPTRWTATTWGRWRSCG